MDAWTSIVRRLVLLLLCIIYETKGQIRPDRGTYVSRGDITQFTALNLTEKDVYSDQFSVTWVPVYQSWNISEVSKYRLSIRTNRENIETVITINDVNSNLYTVFDVTSEEEYYVILYAVRCTNAPDLVSNTLMIRPGRGLSIHSTRVGSVTLLIMLLLGWLATIFLCVRQIHKLRIAAVSSSRDRHAGLSRYQPQNISRVRIVRHHKESQLRTTRFIDSSHAPICRMDELEECQREMSASTSTTFA